jgi:hypothetical protein
MADETYENDRFLSTFDGSGDQVEGCSAEVLPELPPSPWRSLGRRLDYTNWGDRERFAELDAAILARQEMELERNPTGYAAGVNRRGQNWKLDESLRTAA